MEMATIREYETKGKKVLNKKKNQKATEAKIQIISPNIEIKRFKIMESDGAWRIRYVNEEGKEVAKKWRFNKKNKQTKYEEAEKFRNQLITKKY
jgi:hypothetical protein